MDTHFTCFLVTKYYLCELSAKAVNKHYWTPPPMTCWWHKTPKKSCLLISGLVWKAKCPTKNKYVPETLNTNCSVIEYELNYDANTEQSDNAWKNTTKNQSLCFSPTCMKRSPQTSRHIRKATPLVSIPGASTSGNGTRSWPCQFSSTQHAQGLLRSYEKTGNL